MAVKCLSLNLFLIGFLNIVKDYQHMKSLYMLGYESFGRFSDGVRKFEAKVGWVTSFLEKKIIFPSAPVLCIDNDQSLIGPVLPG